MAPMSASNPPGAQRFESRLIRPGDILLTTAPGKVCAVVRKATGSDISHAMLFLEDTSVIDSTDERVQARNLSWSFQLKTCAVSNSSAFPGESQNRLGGSPCPL